MSRVRRRSLSLVASATFAFVLLLVSCLDDSSGPEYQTGYLSLVPSFRSDLVGLVDLDRIGVVITRTLDESIALDTVVQIAPDADSMVLELPVFVSYLGETVSLALYFITPSNDTAFVGGPVTAIVTAKFDRAPTPKEIEVVYVGVGHDAAAVHITTTEAFLFTGDTTTLTAEAVDSEGIVIEGTPIGWISVDTTIATVPNVGVGEVVGGTGRGSAQIVAELLTGQTDSLEASLAPLPSTLTVAAGAGQTGAVATLLPTPIAIVATAADALPVEGVTIVFETPDSGSLSADTVTTDGTGRAETSWTLGTAAGTQTLNVTVPSASGLQSSVTATAAAALADSIAMIAGDGQSATTGTAVTDPPSVVVTDVFGNAVEGEVVNFAVTQGGGSVAGGTPTTDANGIATVGSWTLGAAAGVKKAELISAKTIKRDPGEYPGKQCRYKLTRAGRREVAATRAFYGELAELREADGDVAESAARRG